MNMDNAARRQQQLLDAMEIYRADSDDLRDPQLAELAAALDDDRELRAQLERRQQADVAIKAAMTDVRVPAGLAESVLAKVSGTRRVPRPGSGCPDGTRSVPDTLNAPTPPETDARRDRFSRRRLIAGFAALAASAALLTAVWLHIRPTPPLTPNRVIGEAMDRFSRENTQPGEFVSLVKPPDDYPISPDIVRLRDVRWRRVEKFLGGEAVAYDLPSVGGKVTLYVSHRAIADLPSFAPPVPDLSTGGKSAAAWQSNGMLYVLVVQGDAQSYGDYLDHSSGPLT